MILLALLLAVPPDVRLVIQPGQPHIEKIAPGALAVAGELHAELLPSGDELLVEAPRAGLFHVFLYFQKFVKVYAVSAGQPPPAPLPKPPCAPIADALCLASWRAYLATESAPVQFTLEGLQAEAKEAQAALEQGGLARVQVQLSPFGVKLGGARSDDEARAALRLLYPVLLGPLRIDQ